MEKSSNGIMTLSHKRKAKRTMATMDKGTRHWLDVAASARAASDMGTDGHKTSHKKLMMMD